MSRYKIAELVFPFMLLASVFADASDQGHGTVGMQGSIIDTPCAIVMDDLDQSIELGVNTTGEIVHDGFGSSKVFYIHLTGCSLIRQRPHTPDWSSFQVTFEGKNEGDLFSVTGAGGIGLRIKDENGNVALPGVPLPSIQLTSGGQALEYTLGVFAAPHRLRAGDYRATIRFKVDYF